VRMKAARHLSYTRCALSHAAVSSATARLIIWSDVCKVARRHIWLPGRRRANEIISHRTCALDSAPIDPHQNLWPENAARHITTPCIANIPWEAAATRRQRVDVAPADLMGDRGHGYVRIFRLSSCDCDCVKKRSDARYKNNRCRGNLPLPVLIFGIFDLRRVVEYKAHARLGLRIWINRTAGGIPSL
jgi:hypothetical protein